MTSTPNRLSVVVIGAGQAGLAVSFYLKRLGLEPGSDFVILDRGPGTGGAWQHRWEALRIGSAHRINDLPGMDDLGISFADADRQLAAKDVVADYYAQYEAHYNLRVLRPVDARSVFNRGAELVVGAVAALASGIAPAGAAQDESGVHVEFLTDVVVNATGTWGSPFIPWYPGLNEFAGEHIHTTGYQAASDFEGKSVVVVGGGTSAAGFILELEGVAAELAWVSRRPIEFTDYADLNVDAAIAAVAQQDEAARAGRALPSMVSGTGIPRSRRVQAGIDRGILSARPMFSSLEPDGVRFPDGTFQKADIIVWSTGFRPELRHLAPLKLREKEGGITVGAGAAWKDGRIFFAGYGPAASTIGANRAGRQIARQVVALLSNL